MTSTAHHVSRDAMIDDEALYDDDFRLANGLTGEALTIPSANPSNFHQAISDTDAMPRQDLWQRSSCPTGPDRSGRDRRPGQPRAPTAPRRNRGEDHRRRHCGMCHRPIRQSQRRQHSRQSGQFSFAASAWDVLAATEFLAARPDIDAARVGAQGHSRGGSAVLNAASVHLAAAANAPKLVGVYAAYPWSGQQFLDPAVGSTRIRAIIGDRDDWCSTSAGPSPHPCHPGRRRRCDCADRGGRTPQLRPHHPPRAHTARLRDPRRAHVLHRGQRRLHPADLRRARPRAGRSATASCTPSKPASESAAPALPAAPNSCRFS